jgi:hypothetical protein
MEISRPGLARDLIRLLIAVIRLITAILMLAGGATNYCLRCLAIISTNSFFRTDVRYSSRLHLAAKLAQWCTRMCYDAGEYPTTSTTFVAAGILRP